MCPLSTSLLSNSQLDSWMGPCSTRLLRLISKIWNLKWAKLLIFQLPSRVERTRVSGLQKTGRKGTRRRMRDPRWRERQQTCLASLKELPKCSATWHKQLKVCSTDIKSGLNYSLHCSHRNWLSYCIHAVAVFTLRPCEFCWIQLWISPSTMYIL